MKKKKYLLQDEEYSCGVYCLKMVLDYLGIREELTNIKNNCNLTHNGTTMFDMIECLKYYHIEAKGFEVELDELVKHLDFPCIIHVVSENQNHYIVLYEYRNGLFICGNPSVGKQTLTKGELEQIYSGKVIIITFISKPIKTSEMTLSKHIINNIIELKKEIFSYCIIAFGLSIVTLSLQMYFKVIMDQYNSSTFYLGIIASVTIVLIIIRIIFLIIMQKMNMNFEKRLTRNFVFNTIDNLLFLPKDYYNMNKRNDSITKMQTLFEIPTYIVRVLSHCIFDLITVIVCLSMMAIFNMHLLLIVIPFLLGLFISALYMTKRLNKKDHNLIKDYQKINESIYEYVNYSDNYHLFNMIDQVRKQSTNNQNMFWNTYQDKVNSVYIYQNVITGIIQLMYIVLFLVGSLLIKSNELTIGELIVTYSFLSYIVEPILKVVNLIIESKRINIIFERYKSLYITDKCEQVLLEHDIYAIEFSNVSFGFRGKKIFSHVSEVFTGKYLVMGKNGAGKSTFFRLMNGGYKNYQGSIKLNGVEVSNISKEELQQRICYLDQNSFISKTNVIDFIVGDDQELQTKFYKIIQKFNLSEINDVIGLQIDANGNGMSRGQMQLIAFLRVLLLDYDVYIFDEAFNSMNQNLLEKIFKMIDSDFFDSKLVFIVHHNLNTMAKIDSCVIIESETIKIGVDNNECRIRNH